MLIIVLIDCYRCLQFLSRGGSHADTGVAAGLQTYDLWRDWYEGVESARRALVDAMVEYVRCNGWV